MRIWWVLVLISMLACSRERPAAPAVTPPTQEEAEAFGKEFAKRLKPCDPVRLMEDIDVDMIIARVVAGREIPSEFDRGARASFSDGGLCQRLASYDNVYLRTQLVGGSPRPLVRGTSEQGMTYFQLELDKRGGRLRVVDIYFAASGEQVSQTLRDLLDAMLAGGSADISGKFKRMTTAIAEGRLAEAREAIRSLPPEMRRTKAMMVLRVQASTDDDPAYLAAIDALARAFPGDPALLLHQIDHALLRMQYDAAIAAMDAIDRHVGGDPYLDAMRAGVYAEAGKVADAVAAARRATEREPTLEIAWWTLATQQIANKDFTGAIATFEVLRARFGAEFDGSELRSNPMFAAFLDSAEYAAWSKPQ